jgi:hypothetical protein
VQRTVADHLRGFALRPEETEPREFLIKFAIQVCTAASADETAGLVRVTFSEAHRFPVLRRMYREVTGRAVTAMTNALRLWRDAGRVDFDGDPEVLAEICFAMLTHEARASAVLGDPMTRSEIQRHVTTGVDIFLRGIAPAKARKGARK